MAVGEAGVVDASSGGSCAVGHPWVAASTGVGAGVAFVAASEAASGIASGAASGTAWAENAASEAT